MAIIDRKLMNLWGYLSRADILNNFSLDYVIYYMHIKLLLIIIIRTNNTRRSPWGVELCIASSPVYNYMET